MAEFRLKCPKNYPLNCSLLDTEKEGLEKTEQFKAFLMYQFKGQGAYLVETIKSYFRTPTYYVFDAQKEAGLGVKICKICRLALASDFGIALLTPLNYNVFLEVGFLMGLGKKIVYIVSKNVLKNIKDIPFDLSDQLVIEYSSRKELSEKLEKEIPQFIEPIGIITGYDKAFRQHMEKKLKGLDQDSIAILKFFVLEQGKQGIRMDWINHCVSLPTGENQEENLWTLERLGFIKSTRKKPPAYIYGDGVVSSEYIYVLEDTYRPFLQEYFWKT